MEAAPSDSGTWILLLLMFVAGFIYGAASF
jgi:hypothetical protein